MLVSNFYKFMTRMIDKNDNLPRIRRCDEDNDIVWSNIDGGSLLDTFNVYLGTSATESYQPSYSDFLTTSFTDYSARFSFSVTKSILTEGNSTYIVLTITGTCTQHTYLNLIWITCTSHTNSRRFLIYEDKFESVEYNVGDSFSKQIMFKVN